MTATEKIIPGAIPPLGDANFSRDAILCAEVKVPLDAGLVRSGNLRSTWMREPFSAARRVVIVDVSRLSAA